MRMTREEFLECYEKIYICNEKDKREALEFLDSLGEGNVLNVTPDELWNLIDDTLDFIRKIEKEADTKEEVVAEIKETEAKVIYNFYFS